jgi:hypothetical protein
MQLKKIGEIQLEKGNYFCFAEIMSHAAAISLAFAAEIASISASWK